MLTLPIRSTRLDPAPALIRYPPAVPPNYRATMAAPPEVTINDLTGKYVMITPTAPTPHTPSHSRRARCPAHHDQNKTRSTDTDAILALQGIGWFVRKTIALATITLAIRQYPDAADPSVMHIDIAQTLTGGIGATPEARVLDWTLRPHHDGIFGDLKGKSRFVGVGKLKEEGGWDDVEWLSEGWEGGGERLVQSWVANEGSGWTANQVRYWRPLAEQGGGEKLMMLDLGIPGGGGDAVLLPQGGGEEGRHDREGLLGV